MKRVTILTTLTALLALLVDPAALGQEPQGAPNNINVQGKLAATGGGPVTAGNYTFRFKIFNDSAAGTEIWPVAIGEDHTIAVGTDGLWNARLGKDFPLTVGYMDDTTRWLQITVTPPVGSAETFPRVKLNSNPFTLEAGQLNGKTGAEYVEVAGDVMTGALSMDNNNNATLEASLFGSGGEGALELYNSSGILRSKLWVGGGGALNMYDASGDPQVSLFTDEGSAGARLILTQPDGDPGAQLIGGSNVNGSLLTMYGGSGLLNITLDGDIVSGGDGSVVFPTNAINAGEIKDEPGVSNTEGTNFGLSAGNIVYVIDSVDITIPAAGYVEVICGSYLNLFHTNGTLTQVFYGINKTRGSLPFHYGIAIASVPSVTATSLWQIPATSSRLYSEAAGTHRYYMHADYNSGTSASTNVAWPYIRAKYYPTLYGTVSLAAAAPGNADDFGKASVDGTLPPPAAERTTITVADHNARLEAERAKTMAEIEARLKKLEEQLQQNQKAVENEQ